MTPQQLARRIALADGLNLAMGTPGRRGLTLMEQALTDAFRVKITHAVISAYRPNLTEGSEVWHKVRRRLTAAFEAAGFEVVE